MRIIRFAVAALAAVGAAIMPHPSQGSEDAPPEQAIVRHRFVPAEAAFIPAAVLRETPVEELPLGDIDKRALRYALEAPDRQARAEAPCEDIDCIRERVKAEVRSHAEEEELTPEQEAALVDRLVRRAEALRKLPDPFPGPCHYADSKYFLKPEPRPIDIEKHAKNANVVFSGTVTHAVPGWAVTIARPATMVYVTVDEVFRDHPAGLWIGRQIGFIADFADFEVQRARLCTIGRPGAVEAKTGDQVVVFGDMVDPADAYVGAIEVLPIVEGNLVPQPFRQEWGLPLVPLKDLRARAAPPAVVARPDAPYRRVGECVDVWVSYPSSYSLYLLHRRGLEWEVLCAYSRVIV